MKTEEEIKKRIEALEELLKDDTYADDTKLCMLTELQTLKGILGIEDDNN